MGINEKAAQTTGTNVLRYKWYSVLITGFFVGIAGAVLPLGGTSIFTENMSAGRGFLAVAAIMIAKGNPVLAAVYSFMFAYAQALAASMQNFGIPSQIVLACLFHDHRGAAGFGDTGKGEEGFGGDCVGKGCGLAGLYRISWKCCHEAFNLFMAAF